jgi:tetratricopeptide (TPR) repeat protein
MLVRDESALMRRSLSRLRPVAPEIVVVDNGSSDDTSRVARSMGCQVVYDPTPGFDRLRNHYLDLATQPWILVLDADEHMSASVFFRLAGLLSSASPEVSGFLLPRFEYLGDGHWSYIHLVRLFRNHERIRYTLNGIHDTVAFAAKAVGRIHSTIYAPIHHIDGLIPGRSAAKRARNMSHLHTALETGGFGPSNPEHRMHRYLGQEQMAIGDYEGAEKSLVRAVETDPTGSEVEARVYLAQTYLRLGRLDEAEEEAAALGYRSRGAQAQVPTILAEAAWRRGDPARALSVCRDTLAADRFLAHMHLNCAALLERDAHADPDAVLDHVGQALSLNPDLLDPQVNGPGDAKSLFAPQDVLLSAAPPANRLVASALEKVGQHALGASWTDEGLAAQHAANGSSGSLVERTFGFDAEAAAASNVASIRWDFD